MGKGDLHIHTARGDGMADLPELLDYVQEKTDLTVIAVTEHDDVRPGWRHARCAPAAATASTWWPAPR